MRSRPASTTAQITTLARAALTSRAGPVQDPYARLFLQAGWRSLLPLLRTDAVRWPWFRELLVNVGGRTCFFDEQILKATGKQMDQVVILGAGYDSRALRLGKPGLRFFEVDHAATQSRKRIRLTRTGHATTVNFVTVDFQKDSLAARLLDSGLKSSRPTFFLCEGVLEYLDEKTVRELLRELGRVASQGSHLAMDPLYQTGTSRPLPMRAAGIVATRLMGEPRSFSIDPDDLGSFLQGEGWKLKQTMGAEQLYEKYLQSHLPPPRFRHNYVAVAVPLNPVDRRDSSDLGSGSVRTSE